MGAKIKMKAPIKQFYINNQFGFSLVELLVGLLVSSVLLLSASTQFVTTSRIESDQVIKMQTEEDIRVLVDALAFDLRMIGAGMPLLQQDFAIGDPTLGDKPLPVLLTSNANWIQYRANDRGITSVLTQDFTPSWANRTFSVVDASEFQLGRTIYISNHTVGGEKALSATIANVAGNDITINADYLPTFAMTMESGSVVNMISDSVFLTNSFSKEIYKGEALGYSRLASGATLTLSYLDENGAALALPLTEQIVKNNLTAIEVTVSLESNSPLRGGSKYVATANQKIALRNLILSR